jgi:hypothetical protein
MIQWTYWPEEERPSESSNPRHGGATARPRAGDDIAIETMTRVKALCTAM